MATILVIIDDVEERELLVDALKIEGYDVDAAATCAEARERLHNRSIDLILLDPILPDTTDLDFLHEVRDNCPDALIIVVSSEMDNELVVRALKEGAYDFVASPLNIEKLCIDIKRALEYQRLKIRSNYQNAIVDSIRKVVDLIEAKDQYVESHALGVAELATRLAIALGYKEPELSEIRMAALLHDLGKLGIPESILNKKGKLSDEEMEEVKKHPLLSVEITRQFLNKDMVNAILYHHERWDGSGYPEGRSGQDIPISARIIAIADVFHAMTSDRPYRKRLPAEKVLKFIEKSSGILFGPKIVERFLKVVRPGSQD